MQSFDLVVIGSGPSGQRASIHAAKQGRRVALVERKDVIGGTCINTGTIPSKTMREAVLHLSGFQYQGIYGVNYRVKEKITMADLSFRVQQVIKNEIDVTQAQLSRNGITLLTGDRQLRGPADGQGRERPRRDDMPGRCVHHRHRARGRPNRRTCPSTDARSCSAIS